MGKKYKNILCCPAELSCPTELLQNAQVSLQHFFFFGNYIFAPLQPYKKSNSLDPVYVW
jgi:hypothetical protein